MDRPNWDKWVNEGDLGDGSYKIAYWPKGRTEKVLKKFIVHTNEDKFQVSEYCTGPDCHIYGVYDTFEAAEVAYKFLFT